MSRSTLLAILLTLVFGTPHALGQDAEEVKRLKKEIDSLKKENVELKTKIAELEKNAAKKGGDPFELGTKWKGIANRGKEMLSATVSVIERGEKKAKLRISFENGAVWTYECTTDAQSIKIKGAEREKAAAGNLGRNDLQPVGGTTGSGTASATEIKISYTVPAGNGWPKDLVSIKAEREK